MTLAPQPSPAPADPLAPLVIALARLAARLQREREAAEGISPVQKTEGQA